MTQTNTTTRWQRIRAAIQTIPENTQRRLQVSLIVGPICVCIGWLAFLNPSSPCDNSHHPGMCAVYTAMAVAANTSVENINAAVYVAFGIALICATVADLIHWWQLRYR